MPEPTNFRQKGRDAIVVLFGSSKVTIQKIKHEIDLELSKVKIGLTFTVYV